MEYVLEYIPFLLQITIRSPKGDPLPNAQVDLWHATTKGDYAYRSYALRGRFTTDANGNVEVLSVVPGDYGPGGNSRTGHFHMMIQDAEGRYDHLTTQLYVCKGNNVEGMKKDLYVAKPDHLFVVSYLRTPESLNYVRALRPQNLLHAWSLPANYDGRRFHEFPELPVDNVDTMGRIEWWNNRLVEQAPDAGLKVVAGGQTELKLNDKPGWLGF